MKKSPKGKYAWTAKIGERGQIVIPKEAREIFGYEPGDTVLILGDKKRGGIAIVRADMFSRILEQAIDGTADFAGESDKEE